MVEVGQPTLNGLIQLFETNLTAGVVSLKLFKPTPAPAQVFTAYSNAYILGKGIANGQHSKPQEVGPMAGFKELAFDWMNA